MITRSYGSDTQSFLDSPLKLDGVHRFIYERFGFRYITDDYMVRIPDTPESGYKLRRWIDQVDRLLEIYQVLLKEMKIRHDMIYERMPRMAEERRREDEKERAS